MQPSLTTNFPSAGAGGPTPSIPTPSCLALSLSPLSTTANKQQTLRRQRAKGKRSARHHLVVALKWQQTSSNSIFCTTEPGDRVSSFFPALRTRHLTLVFISIIRQILTFRLDDFPFNFAPRFFDAPQRIDPTDRKIEEIHSCDGQRLKSRLHLQMRRERRFNSTASKIPDPKLSISNIRKIQIPQQSSSHDAFTS